MKDRSGQRREMRRRPLHRPAGLQPPEHREEPPVWLVHQSARAARQRLGAERHGHVEGPPDFDAEEAGRRDADNVVGVAVEHDAAADRRRIAAVLALPEAIADHGRRCRAAATVVLRVQKTTDHRRDAEGVEEVAAHPEATREPRLPAGGQVEAVSAPHERVRECFLAVANLLPQRVGEIRPPAGELAGPAAWSLRDTDFDQLLRILHRQRAQTHGVEQLKDGGVGADAEGQ